MRVVVFANGEFSLPLLGALKSEGFDVVLVTFPPRRAGRGLRLSPTPAARRAEEVGIPKVEVERLKADSIEKIRALNGDVGIVADYGAFIGKKVRELFPKGIYGVHPSLLPKYRGAAPIQRAIMNGERETGVTIFKLVREMDAGDIAMQRSVEISEEDTYGSLLEKLSKLAADMVVEFLDRLSRGEVGFTPQDHSQATYAEKISPEEEWIRWDEETGAEIARKVRALVPKPVAKTRFAGRIIKIWGAKETLFDGKPGEVVAIKKEGIIVAAKKGSVLVFELQPEGKRRMPAASFVSGYRLRVGDRFGG